MNAPTKVGPGRPAVGTKIAVRLPDELIADVDRLAKAEGLTRSALIRQTVEAEVARKAAQWPN